MMSSAFIRVTRAVAAAALLGGAAPVAAAEPTLIRLESIAGASLLRDAIVDRRGLQPAAASVPRATWKLLPGDAIAAAARPPERLIELYTGTPQSPILLCHVLLRYYPGAGGWVPQFLLQQDPLIVSVNGQWRPLELAPGMDGVLVQHGATLPNPEGYFTSLELGLRSGPLAIVGWRVRAP